MKARKHPSRHGSHEDGEGGAAYHQGEGARVGERDARGAPHAPRPRVSPRAVRVRPGLDRRQGRGLPGARHAASSPRVTPRARRPARSSPAAPARPGAREPVHGGHGAGRGAVPGGAGWRGGRHGGAARPATEAPLAGHTPRVFGVFHQGNRAMALGQ